MVVASFWGSILMVDGQLLVLDLRGSSKGDLNPPLAVFTPMLWISFPPSFILLGVRVGFWLGVFVVYCVCTAPTNFNDAIFVGYLIDYFLCFCSNLVTNRLCLLFVWGVDSLAVLLLFKLLHVSKAALHLLICRLCFSGKSLRQGDGRVVTYLQGVGYLFL